MSGIAHSVRLENDEGYYYLVIDNDDGTRVFQVDPDDVLQAVEGYRQHLIEGEGVRQERERAGGISWREYAHGFERTDPDWADALAANADHSRKAERENDYRDHGDESQAA